MSRPAYLSGPSAPGDWWQSTNPQRLAVLHLLMVAVAFLLGSAFAMLSRAEFLAPARALIERDTYGQMVTLHGVMLMVLCAAPAMSMVFGNFLIPRLVGVDTLAHPLLGRWAMRLHALALFVAIASTTLGTVDGGWTLLPPWSTATMGPALLLAISMHLMGVSMITAGVNQIVTIFQARPAEVPLLARTLGVAAAFMVIVATALAAAAVLLFVEATGRADLLAGSMPGYEKLLAFFGRGVVVIVLCGAVGLVSEICASAARKLPHAASATTIALALTGGLYLLGGSGDDLASSAVASAFGLLAAVPATILAMNFLATLQGGAIRLSAPFFLALIAVMGLATGGVAGIFLAAPSTGAYLRETGFATAQMHMLLAGGGLSAFLAAMLHWWPEITGRELGSRRLSLAVALHFAGLQLAFLPVFVLGSKGLVARAQQLADGDLSLARLAAVGAMVLFAGLALFAVEFLGSVLSGGDR